MSAYNTVAALVNEAVKENKKISEIILQQQCEDMEKSREEIYKMMDESLTVMEESVIEGSREGVRSVSGLTGGDAYKLQCRVDAGENICGRFFGKSLANALAVSEINAAMGKIVAAPTAGSCGIMPGVLVTLMKERNIEREKVVMGLFTASALGIVIAQNASIAGASGGCQAECGSASAMAAGAMVEICGGTPEMVSDACAIALKNILGLVCDPVAGLVEIPCIKRNAMGVANAYVGAELALAGIKSAIPADEVILAMKSVGDNMSKAFKETAEGGLATTPTGLCLCRRVFGDKK